MTRARTLLLVALSALAPALAGAQETEPEPSPEPLEELIETASQAEETEIMSEEAALRARLGAILGAVDDFRGIEFRVEAGIVILSGTAPASDAVERAVSVAEKLEGVLLVVDDVTVERGLGGRLADARREVVDQMRDVVASLPLLGAAAAILLLAWLLARGLRDADFLYRPVRGRELLQNLLRQTVYVSVLVAGLVAALRFLDAGALIGTVLGAAGVVGIALGFAFRNVIENYLAGVLLALRQPFKARDLVRIDDSLGTVLRMTSSETLLMDADGNHLRLPNAKVFNGVVLNYTRNPLRRFRVSVGVGTEVDLERAQELGLETLRRMKGVIGDPDPSVRVAVLGDSSVTLEFFGWVDQASTSYAKVESEAHRLIKAAFDEGGIDMPPPAYEVVLRRPGQEAAPAAARGSAPEEIDVAPESDISDQVEEELARAGEENLLDER